MSDLTILFHGHEVQLNDVGYQSGQQANTSGPPEDCYPPESPEIDFKIDTGIPLLDHLLEEHHYGEIEGLAFEAIEILQEEADYD